ncbi:uncharacterized protein [Heliangelus exortis]|uniref:uncharacterized protein isoform X2 n=1 Tax=Heliangelus exortis TaxID=472823 RepID=UPI003A8D54C3
MARRPPSHPKQAWEEVRAPQESSSPAGPCEGWVDLHVLQAHLKHPSPAKNFLALRALVALSEEEEMARRMRYRSLLDDILLCLKNPCANSRVSALLIFHNVMGHLKKKARAIALLLVEELPPFFDDESIQVQELSISLLRKMVESVEGGDEAEREEMKKKIWRALVPLLFHLNEQTDSVAQASQEALLTCADLLENEKLKRRVQRKDTKKIGKLLHWPGHVGGDVLRAPGLGSGCARAPQAAPAEEAEAALLHSQGGHLLLGCEFPERAPVPSSSAARGKQELHGVGSSTSSAHPSLLGFFQLLASLHLPEEHFARTYEFWRFLRHRSQAMLSLVLSGVATLSESPEMVSRAFWRAGRGWESAKRPPCHGGAWWLPGEISRRHL